MQVVSRYPDGVFCWIDLGTTDLEAAKAFYSGLFGWTFVDMPTDTGTIYSMAQLKVITWPAWDRWIQACKRRAYRHSGVHT